jgi:hypothetical protein
LEVKKYEPREYRSFFAMEQAKEYKSIVIPIPADVYDHLQPLLERKKFDMDRPYGYKYVDFLIDNLSIDTELRLIVINGDERGTKCRKPDTSPIFSLATVSSGKVEMDGGDYPDGMTFRDTYIPCAYLRDGNEDDTVQYSISFCRVE